MNARCSWLCKRWSSGSLLELSPPLQLLALDHVDAKNRYRSATYRQTRSSPWTRSVRLCCWESPRRPPPRRAETLPADAAVLPSLSAPLAIPNLALQLFSSTLGRRLLRSAFLWLEPVSPRRPLQTLEGRGRALALGFSSRVSLSALESYPPLRRWWGRAGRPVLVPVSRLCSVRFSSGGRRRSPGSTTRDPGREGSTHLGMEDLRRWEVLGISRGSPVGRVWRRCMLLRPGPRLDTSRLDGYPALYALLLLPRHPPRRVGSARLSFCRSVPGRPPLLLTGLNSCSFGAPFPPATHLWDWRRYEPSQAWGFGRGRWDWAAWGSEGSLVSWADAMVALERAARRHPSVPH